MFRRFRLSSPHEAIFLGVLFRLGVATWNSFWGPSFGAGPDAAGFHENAVAYAAGALHIDFQFANSYIYALGSIYRWTIPALFLGCLLSCLAWWSSALVLVKMMMMLGLSAKRQTLAMFLYALLPSAVAITSVTLREAYQLLAVNCVVYLALRMYITRRLNKWLILLMILCSALLCTLQTALLPAGLSIAVIASLMVLFDERGAKARLKLVLAICILALVAYFGSALMLQKVFYSNLDWAAAIQLKRESWQQSARAAYSVGIRMTSNIDLILFAPLALFHYLFEPMPWRVSAISDWVLSLENVIRALLLGTALAGFVKGAFVEKQRVALVFSAYLVIETIWAVGTINWGTAARHHIPAFGLLLLAAFSFSSRSVPLGRDSLSESETQEGSAAHGP